MQTDFEEAIDKLAGGTLTVFLGLFFAVLFQFITRLVLFRGLSQEDYGIFILGTVILGLAVIIAGLGLKSGVTRFISYSRGEARPDKVRGTIRDSLSICFVSGIIAALFLFLLAGPMSRLFDAPGLRDVLRIFALALPAGIILSVITAIFRGFDLVRVKVIFEDITFYGLSTVLIIAAVTAQLGLAWTAFAMTSAYIITAAAIIVYAAKKLPRLLEPVPAVESARKLLWFSIPLALESTLATMALWTDTIMLGLYKSEEVVGTYNVAVPFANLLPVVLVALIFVFLPLATRLLAEGKKLEVRALYRTATKWAFVLTLPLLLTFSLFARPVILLFGGARYEEAATALAILSLGFFVHVLLGPNGVTLVVLGKPNLLLLDGFFGLLCNIALNALLIPRWGLQGAAVASSISIALSNALKSMQIYFLARIHPFSSAYLKPVVLTVLGGIVLYLPISFLLEKASPLVILVYPVMLVLSLAFTLASHSLEEEDLAFLSNIMVRLRLDPSRVRARLSRFAVAGNGPGEESGS